MPKEPKTDRKRKLNHTALTSGDVARMLGCSSKKVGQWFDANMMTGYRLPAPAQHENRVGDRRFTAADVRAFCAKYKMPVPAEIAPAPPGEEPTI